MMANLGDVDGLVGANFDAEGFADIDRRCGAVVAIVLGSACSGDCFVGALAGGGRQPGSASEEADQKVLFHAVLKPNIVVK